MSVFRNEVGRPSNETLRTRKTLILVLVLVGIALVGGLTVYVTKSLKRNDELEAMNKNAATKTAPYSGDVATVANLKVSDGKITNDDAELILKFSVGSVKPTALQKKRADVDGDGKITSADSRIALRIVAGFGDVTTPSGITSKDAEMILKISVGSVKPSAELKKKADINGDGNVNSSDARLATRIASGYGDVATTANYTRGDGSVTKEDAELILKFVVGLNTPTAAQKKAADMNKDGEITAEDARLALRKATGVSTGLKGDVASAPNYTKADGVITQEDADAILKMSVGIIKPSTQQKKNADFDGDGEISSADSRIALRISSGYGDINRDGKVNSTDARLLQRYMSGLETFNATQKKFADIDGDGKINSSDSRMMTRILSGYGDVATAANYTKADGKITQEDANAILKFSVGSLKPTAAQKKAADIDGDGQITSADARLALRAISD